MLNALPSEMLAMDRDQLYDAILQSEGRTLAVTVLPVSPNLVDFVSNAEVAAAFGADMVILDNFNPDSPSITGLPSKSLEEDEEWREIQVQKGFGYSIKEIRELIGRPVSSVMALTDMDASLLHGHMKATPENVLKMAASGSNIISITNWLDNDLAYKRLQEIKSAVGNQVLIEYFRYNRASGNKPYDCLPEEIFPSNEIKKCLDAGVDIIGVPAPGALPGLSVEAVRQLVEVIHKGGGLAAIGIFNSIEGMDENIQKLAYECELTGADIHELGASGFRLSMIEPQVIMNYSIALRGVGHTYRRMSMSLYR